MLAWQETPLCLLIWSRFYIVHCKMYFFAGQKQWDPRAISHALASSLVKECFTSTAHESCTLSRDLEALCSLLCLRPTDESCGSNTIALSPFPFRTSTGAKRRTKRKRADPHSSRNQPTNQLAPIPVASILYSTCTSVQTGTLESGVESSSQGKSKKRSGAQ